MNAAPPCAPTSVGNRQTLPKPTALPAAASMAPNFETKTFLPASLFKLECFIFEYFRFYARMYSQHAFGHFSRHRHAFRFLISYAHLPSSIAAHHLLSYGFPAAVGKHILIISRADSVALHPDVYNLSRHHALTFCPFPFLMSAQHILHVLKFQGVKLRAIIHIRKIRVIVACLQRLQCRVHSCFGSVFWINNLLATCHAARHQQNSHIYFYILHVTTNCFRHQEKDV